MKNKVCNECGIFYTPKGNSWNWKRSKWCSRECRNIGQLKLLKSKDYIKITNWYKFRFEVFNRDNFKCIYCGKSSIEDKVKLELDHIIPKKQGHGRIDNWKESRIEDFVTSCEYCNQGKKDRILTIEVLKRIKEELSIRL